MDHRVLSHRSTESSAQAHILGIRDDIRSVLDPDGLHTNWVVTDIIQWIGSASNRYNFAFVIMHMDNGTATGPSWIYMFPSSTSGSIWLHVGTSNAQREEYFTLRASTATVTDLNVIALHYNPTITSTPYGAAWDLDDGSLPGGDFSVPTFSPWTEIHDFMPGGAIKGHVVQFGATPVSPGYRAAMLFDHEKKMHFLYRTATHHFMRDMWFSGENMIIPYSETDTNRTMGGWIRYSTGQINGISVSESVFRAYTPEGIPTDYDIYSHENFDRDNSPLSGGDYPWDAIMIYNSDNIKGFINTDIMRLAGHRRKYQQLYDGGKFIQYHPHILMPYVENEVIYPGGS
jgi:hypothetical protein